MTNERDDRIRRRAHEIWESEGRPHGRHDDHWHRALAEDGDAPAKPARGRKAAGAAPKPKPAADAPKAPRKAKAPPVPGA